MAEFRFFVRIDFQDLDLAVVLDNLLLAKLKGLSALYLHILVSISPMNGLDRTFSVQIEERLGCSILLVVFVGVGLRCELILVPGSALKCTSSLLLGDLLGGERTLLR